MSEDARLAGIASWLDDLLGPGHGRRVASLGKDRILLTKVEPGLPGRVLDAVDLLPALFDAQALRAGMPANLSPVVAWLRSVAILLEDAVGCGQVGRDVAAEVMAGVESLGALLESCCWTAEGPSWRPTAGEMAALADAAERLAHGRDGLFSRYYGDFGGRRVENHCPGAGVARRLFFAAVAAIAGDAAAAELAREQPRPYDGESFGPVV